VARELSKKFEEFRRGSISDLITYFEANPPRGEITLVVGGQIATENVVWSEEQVRAALDERLNQGEGLSSAARSIASDSGWDRRAVYALGVNREK
jgi:16S rRNA (cytidine1402-2'-O)-methyltransferase